MADIVELINLVKKDLKTAYKQSPTSVWKNACVLFSNKDNGVRILDGNYGDEDIVGWLKYNIDTVKLKTVVVGRMVVKYGDIVDPNTNKPIIKEKAIMVMGKDLIKGRTRVCIVPCHEHRDYRDEETIDKKGEVLNPAIMSPDVSKTIKQDNKYVSYFTAQFGKETILDSRNGHKFLADPLLNVISQQRLDKLKAEEEKVDAFKQLKGIK